MVQESSIGYKAVLYRVAGVAFMRWHVHLRELLPGRMVERSPSRKEADIESFDSTLFVSNCMHKKGLMLKG